jgi:hypothetical protein
MKLRQFLQGLCLFLIAFSSGSCLCASYFAIAPLTETAQVKKWVAKHPGNYWVEGEDRILFTMDQWEQSTLPGGNRTVVVEAMSAPATVYFYQGSGPLPGQ